MLRARLLARCATKTQIVVVPKHSIAITDRPAMVTASVELVNEEVIAVLARSWLRTCWQELEGLPLALGSDRLTHLRCSWGYWVNSFDRVLCMRF